MAWVETTSPFFRARHSSEQREAAAAVLRHLERTRQRLDELFPRLPGELTVVLHDGLAGLLMATPAPAAEWLLCAPAGRRYVVGWAGPRELHMLSPTRQLARASDVPGSRQMLEHSAPSLYARRVIIASNRDLARVMPLLRTRRALRWAWLLDGAARWFAGQTEHARPAIARRLREGARPSFPPGLRDASLLGGTVIDLLAREQGPRAAARLAGRLHPHGARAALAQAFGGRPLSATEDAWRSHLARVASSAE